MNNNNKLKRGLGRLEATTLVVGGIIGTTIFLVTSDIANVVGSPALVLVTWLVAGLLAGSAALCFAELSAAIPKSGGTYVFLKRAYDSELIAFSFVWMMCFTYATGAIAVVAIMAATYLMPVLQAFGLISGEYIREAAISFIAVLTLLNARGVHQGGITQNIITFAKIGLIIALIAGALILADLDFKTVINSDYNVGGIGTTLQNISSGMILCLFSYSGAFFVTHVAEEVREPEKNIPRAILVGFTIVLVLYLTLNMIYLSVLSFEEVRTSERIAGDMTAKLIGPSGATIVAFIICCSSIGVLNAQLLNYPRIPFALARDGLFFKKIANIDEKSGVPRNALVMTGLVASLYALTGSYSQILGFVAFVSHFFISLAVLAVIVLRIKEPDLPRPYKVWGYPFTPIAFLLISLVYFYNLITTHPTNVLVGVSIVLAGIPFYWYWKKKSEAELINRNIL